MRRCSVDEPPSVGGTAYDAVETLLGILRARSIADPLATASAPAVVAPGSPIRGRVNTAARQHAFPGWVLGALTVKGWALDLVLLGVVGGAALQVRAPYYQVLPAFTDEVEDIYRGFLAAQGQLLPLTDSSAYIGSLWNWLVAAALRLSGYSIFAPRALVLAAGLLTVMAVYLLGRAWGGRVAGLVAAGLLVTSGVHVLVNSHVAWSNSVTPLFTTLAVWMTFVAVNRAGTSPRGPMLLAGLFWGLSLQTHPSVLALLPGAALFLLWRGRWLLKTRWLYAAGGLFVLINLNLLVYNLATGFHSIAYGKEIAASYAPRETLMPLVYLERFARLLLGFFQALGGAVDARHGEAEYLLDPGLWPIALLSAGSVAWLWRRGNPLPALLLLGMVAVLPLLNGDYEPLLNGRYLAPLLPIVYACVGSLFAAALWRARPAAGGRAGGAAILRKLGPAVPGLAVAFLVLHPLIYLRAYYEHAPRVGRTNARFFQTVDQIKAYHVPGVPVLVDAPLQKRVLGPGAGRLASAFRLALSLQGVPHRVVDLRAFAEGRLPKVTGRCHNQLVIMASRKPLVNKDLVARLGLRSPDGKAARVQSQASVYGLYTLPRQPGGSDRC